MVPSHREPSAPGVRPFDAVEDRPQSRGVPSQMGNCLGGGDLAHRPASADQQPVLRVDAVVHGDAAALVEHRAVGQNPPARRLAERRARRNGAEQRDDRAAQPGPEGIGIAVARQHDLHRRDRASSGVEPPAAIRALHAAHAGVDMHSCACLDRGPRETARIAERMQISAPSIEHRARVAVRACGALERLALEQPDGRSAPLELRAGAAYRGRVPRVHGRAQRAVLPRIAVDAVPLHEIEDQRRSGARQSVHAPAEIGAELALHRVRVELEPRIDLSSVAARSAESELLSLEQHHGRARSRRVQRRGESGDAAAHDRHVGAHISLERRRRGRGRCGFCVQVGH